MNFLQSDKCYYNGTDSQSVSFNSTLVIHVVFLFELIMYLLFCYFILEELFFWLIVFFGFVSVFWILMMTIIKIKEFIDHLLKMHKKME